MAELVLCRRASCDYMHNLCTETEMGLYPEIRPRQD
jgi:hypothetical protein